MADATTIARPYAKAIFHHALDLKQLAWWSAVLHNLAEAVLLPSTALFIGSPATTADLQTQLLLGACNTKKQEGGALLQNFIQLLADNKRLLVLPDIYAQFEVLRAEQEKTVTASVSSFAALSSSEEQLLIKALSQRLRREVALEVSIDKTLLGGAVIRAGDLVIDGSVREKLHKLGTVLAA